MTNRILLVLKYFFQQKFEEAIENLHLVFFVSILVGYILAMVAWIPQETRWWAAYIVFIIAAFWTTLLIIFLLKIILEWLIDNWKLANKRADKELRNLNQRSKKK